VHFVQIIIYGILGDEQLVSIKEILSLERFSNFKLINKNADLSREVTSVDITETPDVKDYTSQNTLL
jgi:hypothetical protein